MTRSLIFAIAAAVFAAAGVSARDLSPAAAEAEARRDIAAGHLKIYVAGGRASSEVGVSAADQHLVRALPHDRRLSFGCTDHDLPQHVAYAEAYNRLVVRYLRSRHPHT